jgi:hypothetical protein
VSPSYPPARWSDIGAFCAADGWTPDRTTDHVFWEKTLPDESVLQTHVSFADDEIGEDLFRLILRTQLKVSRTEFWTAIENGTPVARPVEPLAEAPTYEGWVVRGLLQKGFGEAQIHEMTPEAARELLHELWSQPS